MAPEMIEVDFGLDFIASCVEGTPRAPGHHLTDLIRASKLIASKKDIPDNLVWFDPDAPGLDFRPEVIGLMSMGHIWEEASRSAFAARVGKMGMTSTGPEQREFEGVWMNVDGLVRDGDEVVAIQESKFRFASPSDPRDNPNWMAQCKGYCKAYGTLSVWMPIANLTTRPPTARSRIYMINFSVQEVEENWMLISRTRDYLDRLKEQRRVT
jgi:hypothetical protein